MRGFFIVIALFLGGCVSAIRTSSYEAQGLKEPEIQALALDGAKIMAEKYPAGRTSINLNKGGKFADIFANYLRQQGFALELNKGISLSYIVDRVDNNSLRLGLITSNWRSDALYSEIDGKFIRKDLTQRIE